MSRPIFKKPKTYHLSIWVCSILITWIYFLKFVHLFIDHFASPRPILDHSREDSLTYPLLLTAYYLFILTRCSSGLGSEALPSASAGFDAQFQCATLPSRTFFCVFKGRMGRLTCNGLAAFNFSFIKPQ